MDAASDKKWLTLIGIVSVLVVGIVGWLLVQSQGMDAPYSEKIYLLPQFNAVINGITFLLLLTGFIFIKNGQVNAHRSVMITAFIFSIMFLISYLTYHYGAPHTSFGGEGMIKYIYYFVLISHILLAIAIIPLALITLFRAWKMDYFKHKKIAKWTLPIWLYVSLTGVLVYLMISPYYPV